MTEQLSPSSFYHDLPGYSVSGYSETGSKHSYNEDTIFFDPESNLAIVADGSSSTDGAKLASTEATIYLVDRLSNPHSLTQTKRLMRDAIGDANAHIQEKAPGARTTVVIVQLISSKKKDFAIYGNLGDSRGLILRDQQLTYTTKDHSLLNAFKVNAKEKARIQEIIDTIEERAAFRRLEDADPNAYYFFENRNWVTQILGVNGNMIPDGYERFFRQTDSIVPHVSAEQLQPDDIFGIVCDGITDPLTKTAIAQTLQTSTDNNLAMNLVLRSQAPSTWYRAENDDASAIIFQKK